MAEADENMSNQQPSTSFENKEEEEQNEFYSALTHAVNKTIHRAMKSFNRELFAEAYPSIHKHKKSRLNELRKCTVDSIIKNTQDEVDLIFKENSVEGKLNKLHKSIQNHKSTNKKWRPTNNVETDLRPHLMQIKQQHLNNLKEILKKEKYLTRQLEITNNKKKMELNSLTNEAKQLNSELNSLFAN